MSGITEYRDGFINQKAPPGSSFTMNGTFDVFSSISGSTAIPSNTLPVYFGNDRVQSISLSGTGITFVNQSDNLTNTCRMLMNAQTNVVEFDLIQQVFNNDIVVSKQLQYSFNTVSGAGDFRAEIMIDSDGNAANSPYDFSYGYAGFNLFSNSGNNNIVLYDASKNYDFIFPVPEFSTNDITPYFDGLEINFFKTDANSGFITRNLGTQDAKFYHNSTTRTPNPAAGSGEFNIRTRQHLRAKIIKTQNNPTKYGWHIFETKTPP